MPKRSLSRTSAGVRAGVFSDLQRRIDEASARGVDLVPLQIGDTCIAPPDAARYVNVGNDDDALYGYGATAGVADLRAAIADEIERRGGRRYDGATEVMVGVGATHGIACLARATLDPGDEAMLAAPYWPLAHGILRSVGADVVEVPLTQRLYGWPTFDVEAAFERAVTEATRALYVITPNNPDGKVLDRAALEAIARVAIRHDLWVISDEVYADVVLDGTREHVSIATLPGMAERTLVAGSLSKSHALAGIRVGYVAGPADVVAAMRRLSTHSVFNVPVLSQRSALAAIRHGGQWSARARDGYRNARDVAARALEGSGVAFHLPEGATYLFLDFSAVLGDLPLVTLLEAAIDEGVLLAPGAAFGAGFERHARLCFSSVSTPRLLDGIARLRRATDRVADSSRAT